MRPAASERSQWIAAPRGDSMALSPMPHGGSASGIAARSGPAGRPDSRTRTSRMDSRASAARRSSRAWTSPSSSVATDTGGRARPHRRRAGGRAARRGRCRWRAPRCPSPPGRSRPARGRQPGGVQPVDDRRVVLDALHQVRRAPRRSSASAPRCARASSASRSRRTPPGVTSPRRKRLPASCSLSLLQRLLHAQRRPRCRSGSSRRRRCCRCRPRGCRAARARARACAATRARARHLDAGDLLGGLAEPEPVRDRAHAADPLGDVERVRRRQPLDALLQAAVGVEEARLEVQHRLADRAEAEVAGLDDAGVDRAHRHLEHALALDDQVRELLGRLHRRALAGVEALAQRVEALRPAVVHDERPRVGVAGEHDAEQVLRLALVPVGGGDLAREIDGSSGRAGSSEATRVTKRSGSGRASPAPGSKT